jgi:DNA primase
MPKPTNGEFKKYSNYAAHCLQMVTVIKDQEARCILREMAAEWIRLADDLLDPRERKVYQVGLKVAVD